MYKLKIKCAFTQHITREAQMLFWEDTCGEVQNHNDHGDIADVHAALKHALGPTSHLIMELKDVNAHTLLERSDQLKYWTKHFTQLYGTEVPFKDQAFDSLSQMPVADHLDNHQNLSEVVLALSSIKLGKAPGSNGILQRDTET